MITRHGTLSKENAPEMYQHLYDTPIYKRSLLGAGFKKFTILCITYLPFKDEDATVLVSLRGNHFRKKSRIFKEFKLKNKKLIPKTKNYFTSLVDYYVWSEEGDPLYKRVLRDKPQYQFELSQVKAKYPEYFL